MTVRGDLSAILVSRHKIPFEKARDIVDDVLDCADCADCADAYAKWCRAENDEEFEHNECDYYDVIKFLKGTN